jgi:hypothetical protein
MIQTVDRSLNLIPSGVAPKIWEFAVGKSIDGYLDPVIDLARQTFHGLPLSVTLGQDAEDETHQYIALDVDVSGLASDTLLTAQRAWSAGMGRVCPPRYAVYFVLGWQ